jgi:predicted Zn-dependent peptidase
VEHENAEKTIPIILDEYKKIAAEKPPAEELARAKESLKGRLALSLEASDDLAFYVGGEEVLTGKPLTVEEIYRKIDAVTVDDIQKTAQEIFSPRTLNLALIGPFKDKSEFEKLLQNF